MKVHSRQASSAEVEGMRTMKAFLRAGEHLLVVVLLVSSCAMRGCVEANWTLANESRLPKGIELPPGLTRKDVSVDMNTYVPLRGPDVKFIVRDRKGKKLAEVKGNSRPYPHDNIVVINGITEVLALIPCGPDQGYVQDGHIVALFYVLDKPQERNEILTGRLPMCPKNEKNKIDLSQISEGCTCRFDTSNWSGVAGAHP
jgi:hypothetical protein